MDVYELNTHSFIVKIWLEDTIEEADQVTWRGHITHVTTGKRSYIQSLSEIIHFIRPYLQKMGVEGGPFERLRARLKQWLAAGPRDYH